MSAKNVILITGSDLADAALGMLEDYELVFAGRQPTESRHGWFRCHVLSLPKFHRAAKKKGAPDKVPLTRYASINFSLFLLTA